MTMPANVGTGRVSGRFIVGVADGADIDDEPDAVPARGVITFTASVPYLPNPTASPSPTTILKTPIRAVLDGDGYLCTPDPADTSSAGDRGIRLIATDDPDLSVQGWTWNVSYSFDAVNGVRPQIPSHSIALPASANVDLTTVVRVPSSAGLGTEQAEALVASAAFSAARAAEAAENSAAVTDEGVAALVADGTGTVAALDARYSPHGSVTALIPADFSTLQEAVNHYSIRGPRDGSIVSLVIQSGHRPSSGINVADGDFSYYLVSSEDPTVQVADDFSGHFVYAERASAPTLATLVDQSDKGESGYYLINGSRGAVYPGCGVNNALGHGLYVGSSSSCYANLAIFTGSGDRNCWVTRASSLSAEGADFSANKGGNNAVYVSRASHATIENAKITDAFNNAVVSTRSWITATGADVSRAGGSGLLAERGGNIQAESSNIADCGQYGIRASDLANVLVQSASVTGNALYGVWASYGATVGIRSGVVTGNGNGASGRDLFTVYGGVITAHGASTPTGTPGLADTNATAFNTPTSAGMIWA